jgi:hypothetical protein
MWYSLDIMNNDIAAVFSRMENPLLVLLFPPDRLFRMIHLKSPFYGAALKILTLGPPRRNFFCIKKKSKNCMTI